jgi:hypothetical protein
LFLGLAEERIYKRKVDTREELLGRILDAAAAAACIKKREDQLRPKKAIFAQQLQNALRLKVGFSNIYCELKQYCHLNIILKLK